VVGFSVINKTMLVVLGFFFIGMYTERKFVYICVMKNTSNTPNMDTMNNEKDVYTLTKTELKNGKFQYSVTDQNGNIISERKSANEYVACTIDGSSYFGRLDLIGKGDHGRRINHVMWLLTITEQQFASSTDWRGTHSEFIQSNQKRLARLSIAYLK
jgi:hypothetical protein